MGVTGGALSGSQMVDENATESMSLESTESSGAPPGGALSFTRAASQQPQRQPPRRWWARCAGATPSNWMTMATSRWLCLRRRCVIAILPAGPCSSTVAAKSILAPCSRRDRYRLTLSTSETRGRIADHRPRRERRQDGRGVSPEGRRKQGACPPRTRVRHASNPKQRRLGPAAA